MEEAVKIAKVRTLLHKLMKVVVGDCFLVIAVFQNDDEDTLEAIRSLKRSGTSAVRLAGGIGPRGFIYRGTAGIAAGENNAPAA
jgi:hypothetical protein